MDAIVIRNLSKRFRKNTVRREYTTLKSELVRLLKRGERKVSPRTQITALEGINLSVKPGQTFGLVGRNGSGKSTLLKLITGIYTPTEGTIEVNGRISALLELGAGFHPDFSGRENILINGIILGMSRADIRARMDEIIEFSELRDFIDEPVRTYSSGMYMRLAFSIATHVDPDVLIVDEILAVGDEHFRNKSQAKMNEFRQRGKTIFLVTHDLDTLQEWCDSAAWLDGGTLRLVGDPREVVRQYKQSVSERAASQSEEARSAGRLAAPELRQPRSGPPALAGSRWGSFDLELEAVELTGASDLQALRPDASLSLKLRFRRFAEVGPVAFRAELLRSDGLTVFATQAPPRAVPETGVMRLDLPRLGLAPGEYRFDVSCHAGEVCLDAQRAAASFRIEGAQGPGVLALPHSWSSTPEERAATEVPKPHLGHVG